MWLISRKKKMINELKKIGDLEFVFHKMLNSVQVALLFSDQNGNIVYANHCVEQLFGYEQTALINSKVEALIPDRFKAKHIQYRNEFMQIPKSRSMGTGKELYGVRIDKTEFPIEVGLTPVRMVSGLYVLVAIVDITERDLIRKRFEHEKENNNTLNIINDQLSEFSHMVSHDLNNPLQKIERIINNIISYTKQVNEIPEEILKDVDIVLNSITQIKNLVNDLLVFARTSHINLVEISTNPFVNDLIKNYFDLNSNIDIRVFEMPVIKADVVLLRHIFLNLISNAIKYNDKDKKIIEIGFSKNNFYVKDNGIGISKKDIGKLFKPFSKISNDKSGTGIGLSICKNAVEKHGGKIWVESEEKVGTTMFFNI